jgi:mannose/fructose/N-acetylgalactosamine-specific phosphotransferase system component IIC
MPMFDTHLLLAIVGTAVIGGLIGLDRTAVGQFMISQPIVAGPIVGWMLGDLTAGIMIGAVLELIWVVDMPVGTFVPANSTVSAVSATAIAALVGHGAAGLPLIGFSLLMTTGMAPVTMMVDTVIRKTNSRLVFVASAVSSAPSGRTLARAQLFGLAMFYLKTFLLYLVFLPAGIVAASLFNRLPEQVHRAMALFVQLLPFLGVALIARKLSVKNFDLFLLAGFMIAAVMIRTFHVPAAAVVLLTVTGGWVGARLSGLWR